MEDHLLEIFGGHDTKEVITKGISADSDLGWNKEAQAELNKVLALCRQSEAEYRKFARDRGFSVITQLCTLPKNHQSA